MAVKLAGRYLRRVTAWTRRGLALGAALGLTCAGSPDFPSPARADGIMLIQAGAFWMGSDADSPDKAPERGRPGLLRPRRSRRSHPSPGGRFTADPGFEEHPAVEVSWSGARTTRRTAGTAGRSPHGVQDLAGNLREWTASEYRPYPYRPDDGRETAAPRAGRVVRGGSPDDPPDGLRVTIRRLSSYDGAHRGLARGHHLTGFRCATSEDLGGY